MSSDYAFDASEILHTLLVHSICFLKISKDKEGHMQTGCFAITAHVEIFIIDLSLVRTSIKKHALNINHMWVTDKNNDSFC